MGREHARRSPRPAGAMSSEVRISIDLDELADSVAQKVVAALKEMANRSTDNGWLDSRGAATYLGITPAALDKLCAARRVPFQQDGVGAKRWFRRGELDDFRHGRSVLPAGNTA